MILNKFKQALISFRATRLFTIINVSGLILGLSCTLFLAKYVYQEWSTNRFHENYQNLYYSAIHATPASNVSLLSSKIFFNANYDDYPEVLANTTISYQDQAFVEYNNSGYRGTILYTDTAFADVFSYETENSNLKDVLKSPQNIIVTAATAKMLFGKNEALGQTVEFMDKAYTVAGVLKRSSLQSSMKFDFIFTDESNRSKGFHDYVLLDSHASIDDFNTKVEKIGQGHPQFPESKVLFKPFSELYYTQEFSSSSSFYSFGNKQNIKVLALIATIIFLISILNYINIYNVTLQKRGKEFGVRKVIGAGDKDIILNFFLENFIYVVFAVFVSFLISYLFTPYFESFIGRELIHSPINDLLLLLPICFILTVLISLLPSIKHLGINPIKLIEESIGGKRVGKFRKTSMVIQYSFTIALIIVSLFFIKQLNFMMNKDLGYTTENIIKIKFFDRLDRPTLPDNEDEKERVMAEYSEKLNQQQHIINWVVDEIDKNPHLTHLSFGDAPKMGWDAPWKKVGGQEDYKSSTGLTVTTNSASLFGFKITEGRFFDSAKDKSRANKVVINESARRYFGIESLDNAELANRYWGGTKSPWKIIGVVEDFNYQHLSQKTPPTVILYFEDRDSDYYMCHITSGKEQESIEYLQNIYKKVHPDKVFEYEFVENDIAARYAEDKNVAQIYTIFAIIAMIISSMGLFSFSVYEVQQRVKEIGIRKVNGSSIKDVILQLTKSFFVLITIAFIVAIPLASWSINHYLEAFAFKSQVSWWLFAIAGMLTFIVAFSTLIWQSWQSATTNPVEALRNE